MIWKPNVPKTGTPEDKMFACLGQALVEITRLEQELRRARQCNTLEDAQAKLDAILGLNCRMVADESMVGPSDMPPEAVTKLLRKAVSHSQKIDHHVHRWSGYSNISPDPSIYCLICGARDC